MSDSILANNKQAYFNFEVLEKIEAGIILSGAEVKSIKAGRAQLKGGHVTVENGKAWLEKVHVSPYSYSSIEGYDPIKKRQLLLHKEEIERLTGFAKEKGMTIIPLELYRKKHLIKILIGVCRGKKKQDKRHDLKKKAVEKDLAHSIKSILRSE